MKNRLRNGIVISLVPQFILVQWLSGHPDWIERYYSNGIYPFISRFFRFLLGWIPFSVGELIYSTLIFLAIRYIVRKRKSIRTKPWLFLRNVALVLSVFYFTFHMMWGFNYYRQPIAEKLNIRDSINQKDLLDLTARLIKKTNTIQYKITGDSTQMVRVPYNRTQIFDKTVQGYSDLQQDWSFLQYPLPSIKKSMYSTVSSYLGIGGYLNPFTNEAQVNALTPVFRFPVISGHEVGHQVGYSAENETNFIGYLVTVRNKDIYFQYSAYAYALSYCLSTIAREDEAEFKKWYALVNEGTQKNYQELRDHYDSYKNPFEPIFESIFSAFLKANNQKDGIQSYGRVVSLLVGYHEKYPL